MRHNRSGRFANNHKRFNGNSAVNKNTQFDSNGPAGKIRGTAFQLVEKYTNAAKDCLTQGDDIMAEICRQFADHYFRIHLSTLPPDKEEQDVEPPAPAAESGADAHYNRPTRSQRAASYKQAEPEAESHVDDGPTAKDIETEFTVPDVENMDLSIPISVLSEGLADRPETAPEPKRTRGRPKKVS
jgi:hypothetical protein